jgi:hypothetical protein
MLGRPEQFCSRACIDIAWGHRLKDLKKISLQKQKEGIMEVKAEGFGSSGVTRRICDNPSCRKPIHVSWKGRYGEYCCNECYEIREKEGNQIMSDNETPVEANDSPIVAGDPEPKKEKPMKAKKTKPAPKKAPAKKAAKKAPAKQARKSEPKELRAGSKQAQAVELMSRKTGATLAELAKKFGWIEKTVTGMVSNLRKAGVQIESFLNSKDERSYRI